MNPGKTLFAQIMDFLPWRHLRSDCRALRWQPRGAEAILCDAVLGHGLRPTDLPGEFARHRGVPVGTNGKALPYGFSRAGSPFHPRGCQ
jgi:hypothetical protein